MFCEALLGDQRTSLTWSHLGKTEREVRGIWRRGQIMCKSPEVGLREGRTGRARAEKEKTEVGCSGVSHRRNLD